MPSTSLMALAVIGYSSARSRLQAFLSTQQGCDHAVVSSKGQVVMGAMASSSVALVDRNVIPVRIFDHRHSTDGRVERFCDERHGPLLHLLHKGVEV